ncbi:hypothetical protein NMY22_g11545 [Coprinellus aureogranulatus]|nr:hypothetical protein NMY22_g11545 [Coprinellus aureogranulatus]
MVVYPNPTSLNGWHPGEIRMQRKLGYDQAPGLDQMWRYIYSEMTDQQRIFHTSNLHFLPVVTLDKKGRPWSSVLTGSDGQIGWIKSVKPTKSSRLEMKPRVTVGDPFWDNVDPFREEGSDGVLFAGIGVEVSTRRRNKLAGKILNLQRDEESRDVTLTAHVYENTGNCPKYIVVRSVEPHITTHPVVVHENLDLGPTDRLPADVVSFIHAADTIWFGSAFISSSSEFPSHRRHQPPRWSSRLDFSGNRFMSSLGNIEVTPVASVTIVDWDNGDILYLTGDAVNLVGEDAERVMPLQKALTELRVTGYRFVKDAVTVRQKVEPEISPYSPPVKLLREELEAQGVEILGGANGALPEAKLEKVELHSPTIATFTFKSSVPASHPPCKALCAKGVDIATVNIQAGIVGISGEFYLDLEKVPASRPELDLDTPRRLVWAAGGIGITPFITMLRALVALPSHGQPWDIIFLLSTREPEVLLPLLAKVFASATTLSHLKLHLHVFSSKPVPEIVWEQRPDIVVHEGRLKPEWFRQEKDAIKGREAFICGSPGFENMVLDAFVHEVGLEKDNVRKEGFAY